MGYLRKANLSDLNYVCNHLRILDKIEAWYQTGQQPEEAVKLTYLAADRNLAIAGDNDQPMGLCGVVVNGVSGNEPGMDFLKKDYRAVMKAVDKKQGK